MTPEIFKARWDYIQALADIDGDCWMGLFTALILYRLAAVTWGQPPLTPSEASAYCGAIGSFAYSNKGQKV